MKTPDATAPQADELAEASAKREPFVSEASDAQSQALYALIAQQPFFKGLTDTQLQLLTNSALQMQFESGQTIFAEGSPANRFYLILNGKVVIESEVAEHNKTFIQTLGAGDDLGWSWLFAPYLFHFTAHAVEPTRTIFFYGTRLREQCEQDHELGYQLMKRVAEVATQRLRATQLGLLKCYDPTSLNH